MRGILSPSTRLHLEINAVLQRADATQDEMDRALARCGVDECGRCSVLVCPHGDPLHLRHSGCPSCAEEKT